MIGALTAETAVPIWSGRTIVRAAGGMALHVAVEGAQVPAAAMFTVPVECAPDAESAPGVRPWRGPVDERALCPPCLRALRGEPDPGLSPAGETERLPEPDAHQGARRLWAVPDLPTYTAPSLPPEYGGQPILWSEWIDAPKLSHGPSACDWCGDAGPCVMAGGRQGNPLSKDKPLRWFAAYRCSYCQETNVYEQAGAAELKLIAHFKPKSPKGARA
ncbi:hypothetical protein [Streptomyces sp. NPDC059003]|uniref:hypothetical protein n=1 Tax=Streptomyces sp. NPDC059003 TaxID=3346691 RepID=UPI00369CC69A